MESEGACVGEERQATEKQPRDKRYEEGGKTRLFEEGRTTMQY